MSSHAPGLVPVHIGQPEPGSEQERMLLARQERMRDRYGRPRLPRVPGGLEWQKHGLEPRWLGMETSDCSVAVELGYFTTRAPTSGIASSRLSACAALESSRETVVQVSVQ